MRKEYYSRKEKIESQKRKREKHVISLRDAQKRQHEIEKSGHWIAFKDSVYSSTVKIFVPKGKDEETVRQDYANRIKNRFKGMVVCK